LFGIDIHFPLLLLELEFRLAPSGKPIDNCFDFARCLNIINGAIRLWHKEEALGLLLSVRFEMPAYMADHPVNKSDSLDICELLEDMDECCIHDLLLVHVRRRVLVDQRLQG
jgi:hypothetical protein